MPLLFCIALLLLTAPAFGQDDRVRFVEHDTGIDVFVDDAHVTTYRFSCEGLKPCLHPVRALDGTVMTRGYPLEEVEGESQDHPHHTGVYLTYDHVNDTNFWDVHDTPPYIAHVEILEMEPGDESGLLAVLKQWIGPAGRVVLEEDHEMEFVPVENGYALDFTITLTPPDTTVFFEDSKEGFLGIRVADWLNERDGAGEYLSANGERTEENVWGKRAAWMRLESERDGATKGIVLMNHPESVNYPTYWHARGYGLFAANPLGQGDFEERRGLDEPEPLHLTLAPGESALFKFRMLVYDGPMAQDDVDAAFERYSGQ